MRRGNENLGRNMLHWNKKKMSLNKISSFLRGRNMTYFKCFVTFLLFL